MEGDGVFLARDCYVVLLQSVWDGGEVESTGVVYTGDGAEGIRTAGHTFDRGLGRTVVKNGRNEADKTI